MVFEKPITLLFQKNITATTAVSFTGKEGDVIVKVPGLHTEVKFNYTVAENSAAFVFGFSTPPDPCLPTGP